MLHAEFEKPAIRKGVVAFVTAQDSTIAVTSGGNYANHSTVVFLNYVYISVSQPFPVQGPVEKPTKFCGPPKIMP
jgi:hypothetical protein